MSTRGRGDFSELKGKAGRIGQQLVDKTELMFKWWHRVRDGTLSRKAFQKRMLKHRSKVENLLIDGEILGVKPMAGACREIIKESDCRCNLPQTGPQRSRLPHQGLHIAFQPPTSSIPPAFNLIELEPGDHLQPKEPWVRGSTKRQEKSRRRRGLVVTELKVVEGWLVPNLAM